MWNAAKNAAIVFAVYKKTEGKQTAAIVKLPGFV